MAMRADSRLDPGGALSPARGAQFLPSLGSGSADCLGKGADFPGAGTFSLVPGNVRCGKAGAQGVCRLIGLDSSCFDVITAPPPGPAMTCSQMVCSCLQRPDTGLAGAIVGRCFQRRQEKKRAPRRKKFLCLLGREGRVVVRLDDERSPVFPEKAHQGPACSLLSTLYLPLRSGQRLRLAMFGSGQDVLLDGPVKRHEMGGEPRDAHDEVPVSLRPLHGREEELPVHRVELQFDGTEVEGGPDEGCQGPEA